MPNLPEKIRKAANDPQLRVTIRVGKSGITDNLVAEIDTQLKNRDMVKIKANKGLFDSIGKKEVWQYLCEQTSSRLVVTRGNIAVLWRI